MPGRFGELRLRNFLTSAGAVLTPRMFAAGVILVGFATMLMVNWPGHLEFDSIRQLLEGRRGVYSNWHPPIMSWILGVFDAVVPGGALFVLFDALLAFGALLSLLWLVPRPSWWAVAAALVIVALPQLFLFQAIVWKDMLFADACVAGFVCLGHTVQQWSSPRLRFALLGASALFVSLAILSRQNGVIVLPCAALALTGGVARIATRRQSYIYGASFLLGCALLVLAVNAGLQLRAAKAYAPIEQLEDLQLYDIGGMLKRQPDLPLPILDKEEPPLGRALRAKAPRLFTPVWHDRLTSDPEISRWIPSSVSAVSRQWRALIVADPGTYLAVRAKDFGWLFLSQHLHECLTFVVGVISIPADLKAAKLPFRYDDRDDWLNESYATPLLETPAFSHPFFAAIGLMSLVVLLIRRRPADFVMAGLLIAAFLYTLSYFFVSVACQYRYLYALDLAGIASAFYLMADLRPIEWWRGRNAVHPARS
jgi:hypothetical protein